jgi:hypothetical protein
MAVVRLKAYGITTSEPEVIILVSEVPDRSTIIVSIGARSVRLNKAQWDALTDLRYEFEVEEGPVVPVRSAVRAVPGVPPGERQIALVDGVPIEPMVVTEEPPF